MIGIAAILGLRIKELRMARGLTQAELGARLNKGGSTVRMWELDKSTPDIETIVLLSQVFGVSTDFLLNGKDAPQIFIEPAPIPKDKQIGKITKELAKLNQQQLKLVGDLVREIAKDK